MKLKNKLLLIVFIFIAIYFIKSNSVQALTQEEAGKYIAEFAINFCDNYANQTIYSWTDIHRFRAYNDVKTSGVVGSGGRLNGTPFTDKYAMDCVGWVSFAIHHALGIDSNIVGSADGYSFSFFVVPTSCTGTDLSVMERVSGDIKPGDILVNSHHVMVYVGNNTIVDSAGAGTGGAISKRTLDQYGQGYSVAYRIKESVASGINESSATTIFNGNGGLTNSWTDSDTSTSNASERYQNGRVVDVNDKLPLYKHILLTEKYNFNSIKWKKYGHGYEGSDIEMQEDTNLGLKYPKDESNTSLSEFMKFSIPYLQTWMIPLAMNAGIEAQGKDTTTNRNPLFPYTVIKQAMSDILVNKYDVTTCTLVTKYPVYDIIDYTIEYQPNYDETGKLIGLTQVNEYETVVESGVTGEEEFVSKNIDIEPNYFIKEAKTFDKKLVTEIEYTKYSDSDVENRIEGGVGFQGRTETDGSVINETLSTSNGSKNNYVTLTTRKKVGVYKNVTRVWKDEIEKVGTEFSSYTIEDVKNYKPKSSTTSSSGQSGSSGGAYEWDTGGLQTYDYASLPGEEIEFELTFYCGINNAMEGGVKGTHDNTLVYGNVASNYWSGMSSEGGWHSINNGRDIGTKIYLEGVGLFTVEDRGGSNEFNQNNRIDIFVERKEGESDAAYEARTNSYGRIKIKGKVLPTEYDSHQHSNPDTNQTISSATSITSNDLTNSSNNISSLDNFLFIGDSLTAGLSSSGGISGANIIGVVSSSAYHWNTYLDGGDPGLDFSNVNLPDASNVSGICIELGINSLNIQSGGSTDGVVSSSVNNMKTLLEKISSKYPDKTIYVQRVFPIGNNSSYDKEKTNSVIKEYNDQIEAYCSEKGYKYIDATEGYIDDDGTLLSSMTTDGVHFSDYSLWGNNLKDVILNNKSTVSQTDTSSEKFNVQDLNYYNFLETTDYINLIDIMNSHSDNYLEYLKKSARYSPHVGYTRSFLTFSYSQLKRLFKQYFENGKVPYIYGESLGYDTYTESNEIKAGKVNQVSINNNSGAISGNIATIPGAVQVPDGLGKVHTWTIWNHVNEQYNPESTWPASSNQGKLILHLTNNNERSLHGELSGDITANSKRMVCYGEWLASAMVSELGGTQGNPEKKLQVGDFVFIIQDNGTFYPVILTDTKVQFNATYYDPNPANEWGHDNGQTMVEFQGYTSSWRDVPSTPEEFNHYIKQVYVVGNVYTNPEYLNDIEKAAKDVGLDPANLINPKTM